MLENLRYSFIDCYSVELPEIIALSIGKATFEKIAFILKQYETPTHHLMGCLYKDKLRGVIGFELKHDHILIKHIAVCRDLQKQGIGTTLLKNVINHYPYSSLQAETDHEAVQFYQKNKFECRIFQGKHGPRYKCYFKKY